MQRLAKTNINTPKEYDRIFEERAKKGPDWQDLRRWKMLLAEFKKGNLVDLGCLDSEIPNLLGVGTYTGIDLSENSVRQMIEKFPFRSFYIQDITETDFKKEVFDYAILGEVLEHLEEPEKAIKEAFRILKPGGVLAISVPLEEAREPGAVDGERHLWSFSKEDVVHLLKDFEKVKIKVLRSQYFPRYRYCWPTLICYAKKPILRREHNRGRGLRWLRGSGKGGSFKATTPD